MTLIELALVVAIIGAISVLAYPSLRATYGRDQETGLASHLSHLLNQMKERAKRRNRAHLVSLVGFSAAAPRGELRVVEANTSSCRAAVEQEGEGDNVVVLASLGQTAALENEIRFGLDKEELVGLFEAEPAAALAGNRVFLCLKPDGAVLNGHTLEPFPPNEDGDRAGTVTIRLQRFRPEGGVAAPPRAIIIPFAGPTRLSLEGV